MDPSDSSVMLGRARDGSREAMDRLFAQCGCKLLALIRLRLGAGLRATLESGDILQMTFLTALQKLHQFRGSDRATLMAWLARIAENEIRQQAEFQGRQKRDVKRAVALDEAADRLEASVRSASSWIMLHERHEQLERALEGLPQDIREIIILRRLEELSYAEIGKRLNKSPDACRMQFSRAMATLTTTLRESS